MDIQVNIVEVKILVTTYVTGIEVTYNLLLLKHQMKAVGAVEDYQLQQFIIKDPSSQRVTISPTLSATLQAQQVEDYRSIREANILKELEEEQAKEAIEDLFKELDKEVERRQTRFLRKGQYLQETRNLESTETYLNQY